MFKTTMKSLAVCSAIALGTGLGPAQAGGPKDNVIAAELLPGWATDRGTQMVGLRLKLAPGWKTYWRAPGDGGIPPQFDWSDSENLRAVATHWPRPNVYQQNGMRTIAYEDEVVLPLELSTVDGAAPVSLHGRIALGVCQDICMPMELEVQAELPAKPHPAPIRAALAERPMSARQAGVRAVTCEIEPIADGLRLTARIDMPAIGRDEAVVVELSDSSVWVAEPSAERSGRQLVAMTDLVPANAAPFALDRSQLRFTVLGKDQAVDIRGCKGS